MKTTCRPSQALCAMAMLLALGANPAGAEIHSAVGPTVDSFAINNGAASTTDAAVTLNNTCSGSPTQYMASESSMREVVGRSTLDFVQTDGREEVAAQTKELLQSAYGLRGDSLRSLAY